MIEADEYDTAFFDKRAKFVHYHPRTLVLNNLEFDHADIYPDIASIQRQFHHLVRTVPGSGAIIWNAGDERLAQTLKMGCWTPLQGFSGHTGVNAQWRAGAAGAADYSRFEVLQADRSEGSVEWELMGAHNMENALAAIAAAHHAGVPVTTAIEALRSFKGIARRMQLRGEVRGIRVYDDSRTIRLRLPPRSMVCVAASGRARVRVASWRCWSCVPTPMRMGVHNEHIAPSLAAADEVYVFTPPDLGWDTAPLIRELGARGHAQATVDGMAASVAAAAQAGDSVLVMSNGGFGGLHEKLLTALRKRFE